VAAAAVLAACGDDDDSARGAATTTTTVKPGAAGDVTILRTASSLELVAADAYDKVVKAGLITTPAVLDAAKVFMEQHEDHAALFESLTKKLGGTPFTEPNPALSQQLAPRVTGLSRHLRGVRRRLRRHQPQRGGDERGRRRGPSRRRAGDRPRPAGDTRRLRRYGGRRTGGHRGVAQNSVMP
jgi:hypothetical protein